MKQRRIVIAVFLAVYLAGHLFGGLCRTAKAATDYWGRIGLVYEKREGGSNYNGVLICRDGVTVASAHDLWKYRDGSWQYQESDICGDTTDSGSTLYRKYMGIMDSKSVAKRFMVIAPQIARDLPEQYVICVERYARGELLSREYEMSGCTLAECLSEEYSLMRGILESRPVLCGQLNPEGISYRYDILTGKVLGEEGDIRLDASGGMLRETGLACYSSRQGYIVQSLPVPVREPDAWQYDFLGWYDVPDGTEGGKKLKIQDLVQPGETYYAHWNKTEQTYPVTCIDIAKEEGKEIRLGQQSWQGVYGDRVSGAEAGSSKEDSAYYPGYVYEDCSDDIVTATGAVVKRYFGRASYDVECRDIVVKGPDAGQLLGLQSRKEKYGTVVSGAAFGCENTVGSYYRGYRYTSCSSGRVEQDGCTVNRFFTPITYNIALEPQPVDIGTMSAMTGCYYGHPYTLIKNTYIRRSRIALDWNAPDAACETSALTVYQEFAGWSDTPGGAVRYSDGAEVCNLMEEDGTKYLYAVWSEKELQIDVVPKRMGYEFAGWAAERDAKEGKRQFSITGDMTLYAVWTPAVVDYSVEYYKQKLDKTYEKVSQYEFQACTGSVVELEELSDIYPGFWLDASSSVLRGKVKADGSLVLAVYFQRGEYTVTFDCNGGLTEKGTVAALPAFRGRFEEEFPVPDTLLYREGYQFAGWGLSPDTDKVSYRPGEQGTILNHDQTLYAVWLPVEDVSAVSLNSGQSDVITGWYENRGLQKKKVKKGMKVKRNGVIYRVMQSAALKRTVCVLRCSRKKKAITVPNAIRIGGKRYFVIRIENRAFANCSRLQKVTFGKRVTELGRKIFSRSKNLRKVRIQSVVLQKINRKVWKGMPKECRIRVIAGSSAETLVRQTIARDRITL